jgi:hypothetical protein
MDPELGRSAFTVERLTYKIWLGSFLSLIVSFIYNILALFDIFPTVTQRNGGGRFC